MPVFNPRSTTPAVAKGLISSCNRDLWSITLTLQLDLDHLRPRGIQLHAKQGVARTGRNTTGPPSRAASWWVTLRRRGVLQTTTDDDDRRQRAKQYWPPYTMCRRATKIIVVCFRSCMVQFHNRQVPAWRQKVWWFVWTFRRNKISRFKLLRWRALLSSLPSFSFPSFPSAVV